MNIRNKISSYNLDYRYIIFVILIIALLITSYPLYNYITQNNGDPKSVDYHTETTDEGILVEQLNGSYIDRNVLLHYESKSINDSTIINLPPPNQKLVIEPVNMSIESIDKIRISQKDTTIHTNNITYNKQKETQIKGDTYYLQPNEELNLDISDITPSTDYSSYVWDTGTKIVRNDSISQKFEKTGVYNMSLKIEFEDKEPIIYNIDVQVGKSNYNIDNSGIYLLKEPDQEFNLSAENFVRPNSKIDDYRWNFNDGTNYKYGDKVNHSYNGVGEYNVTLDILYSNKETETRNIKVKVVNNITYNNSFNASKEGIDYNQSGYEFVFNTNINYEGDLTYIWEFGDNNTIRTEEGSVEHTYSQYGKYTVDVTVENQRGRQIQTYSENIETEVIVIMGDRPFSVQSVSGDHAEELLPNNEIGDLDPQLAFREDHRYVIRNIPVDIAFIAENGEELLTQSGEGTMEDVDEINWVEKNDSVEFTVTKQLGNLIYGYEED